MSSAARRLGRARARLTDKCLFYTTKHGRYTVAQFDRYMRRSNDLSSPPRRR